MPKINVYLPDELADAVREAGVPVSAICQRALEQAVRRVTSIRETAVGDLTGADLATRLPHFTARSRTVLALGIERAGADGATSVGTGHLLGGMLAEGSNLALHVLRAVDIDPTQVMGGLGDRPLDESTTPDRPDGPTRPSGAGPLHFSGPAANALELAVTEATAFGHNYVGCEHLLLGLIAEPDGVGGQVLRSVGGELRLVRRAVAAALAGYVYLRAQTATALPPGTADPAGVGVASAAGRTDTTGTQHPAASDLPGARPGGAAALIGAVRAELRPLIERIERIERHVGLPAQP